jgi:hypothetical protein
LSCFNRVGRAVSSAGRLGGSAQEFVIAAQLVFRDLELGQGRKAPRRPQAVVITQGAEADLAFAELTPQVPLHSGQVIGLGGDMECIDHDLGRLVRRQGSQQRAP